MNCVTCLLPLLVFAATLPAQDQVPARSFQTLLAEGQKKALAHKWKTAVELLDRAVKLAPDNVEGLRWRGHAYTGFKQYDKALTDLDRAVELYAKDSWTQYARAMALHHLGRYEEAVRGYTVAHELDPSFSKPLEWRGFNLSLLGEHIRALADIQQAIKQNRGNAWLWFIRAKTYVALLDFVRAEEDLWRVVDAEAENADAHAQLGYISACTGNRSTARTMLRRAVKLEPLAQIEARNWLYHLQLARGDAKLATAELDAVLAEKEETAAWPRHIARFLHGDASETSLLTAAKAAPQSEGRGRICEAWLHIALRGERRGIRPRPYWTSPARSPPTAATSGSGTGLAGC